MVECYASEVAVSAMLNQSGRPIAFMSRTLQGNRLQYPPVEKEATTIIEAVHKWRHSMLIGTWFNNLSALGGFYVGRHEAMRLRLQTRSQGHSWLPCQFLT